MSCLDLDKRMYIGIGYTLYRFRTLDKLVNLKNALSCLDLDKRMYIEIGFTLSRFR